MLSTSHGCVSVIARASSRHPSSSGRTFAQFFNQRQYPGAKPDKLSEKARGWIVFFFARAIPRDDASLAISAARSVASFSATLIRLSIFGRHNLRLTSEFAMRTRARTVFPAIRHMYVHNTCPVAI